MEHVGTPVRDPIERWTRRTRERPGDPRTIREMAAMLELSAALLRAETAASAVRSVVQLSFERLRVPIVGLLPQRSGNGWFVAAARGMGPRRSEIGRAVEGVSALRPSRSTRTRLAARVGQLAGRDRVEAIPAGDAVLIAADLHPDLRAFVRTAAALLDETLAHLGAVDWARMRNDNLDLALAWTAHELRGPLVDARTALGHVQVDEHEPRSRELLQRSRDELDQLAELVDPLLEWSTGSGPLRKRPVDLFGVVDEALTSCRREDPRGDVVLLGEAGVSVSADPQQLRVALSNVIRNAIAYSPAGSVVTVAVRSGDGYGRVVVRDRGPGVPAAERHLLFDPFARGTIGKQTRSGTGLGLFIARRIVEAHGGSIGARVVRPGMEFRIDLPIPAPRRLPSAS